MAQAKTVVEILGSGDEAGIEANMRSPANKKA